MSESVWMTTKDVMAILPIGKTAFEKLVRTKKIPSPTKFGKTRYWKSDEIHKWIDSCKQ